MTRRSYQFFLILVAVPIVIIAGAMVFSVRIRSHKAERETYFISIRDGLNASWESLPHKDSLSVQQALMNSGIRDVAGFLKPFRYGLTLQRTSTGFILEEAGNDSISLFRKDRLVASESDWPHWLTSGEAAGK